MPLIAGVMVLLLSLAAAAAMERVRLERNRQDLAVLASRIEGRIETQTSLLSFLRAFLVANDYRIDLADIRTFLQLSVDDDLTRGMQGIGIALFQTAGSDGEALSILRSAYGGAQRIWPETDQPYRFPIVILEPPNARNQAAYGFDMYSEATRRGAINRAWRSGRAAATGPVELVQEITAEKQSGFLMYLPVMAADGQSVHSTVYAPYRVGDLMRTALSLPTDLGIEARVVDAETGVVMLEPEQPVGRAASFPIMVADREWRMDLAFRDPGHVVLRPSLITILFGGLLAVLLQRLLQQREQRIAAERKVAREAQQAAELRGLLLDETKHRLKNAVARISAIARLTARDAGSKEEFLASLERHLQALAAAQDLLNPAMGGRIDLHALLQAELASVGGSMEAIRMDGPPLSLDPDQAQALGLVLHELLTNALKYGALKQPGGSLEIRWTIDGMARLDWVEQTTDLVPQGVSGFGTRLIETLVKRQLGGTLTREVSETGFRLVIGWPLARAGA